MLDIGRRAKPRKGGKLAQIKLAQELAFGIPIKAENAPVLDAACVQRRVFTGFKQAGRA